MILLYNGNCVSKNTQTLLSKTSDDKKREVYEITAILSLFPKI